MLRTAGPSGPRRSCPNDYRHYVIFYRPIGAGIEIVRVLDGSRDILPFSKTCEYLPDVRRGQRASLDDRRRAGVWRINGERLDDRIKGQRDLVALHGKPVMPPGEVKFYPAVESPRWREQHLVTVG